jgi:hypothetical protein
MPRVLSAIVTAEYGIRTVILINLSIEGALHRYHFLSATTPVFPPTCCVRTVSMRRQTSRVVLQCRQKIYALNGLAHAILVKLGASVLLLMSSYGLLKHLKAISLLVRKRVLRTAKQKLAGVRWRC